jgi:hypothetical protein
MAMRSTIPKKLNMNFTGFSETAILRTYSTVNMATVTYSIHRRIFLEPGDNPGRVSIEKVINDRIIIPWIKKLKYLPFRLSVFSNISLR